MSKITKIEWTQGPDGTPGATWNPWMGCTKVSAACANCYASRDMARYGRDFSKITRTSPTTFNAPLKWKEPKKIFICSWSDFYHIDVPIVWRMDALSLIERCPQHTWLLLTKRPENIRAMDYANWCTKGWPSNVWLGVTVENQEQADKRIPLLLEIPAKTRFLSMEPLLGPVDLWDARYKLPDGGLGSAFAWGKGINHVIVGGESGPNARPMNPNWVRRIQQECEASKTPMLMKQWGEWKYIGNKDELEGCKAYKCKQHTFEDGEVVYRMGKKNTGCMLDGKQYKEFPNEKH